MNSTKLEVDICKCLVYVTTTAKSLSNKIGKSFHFGI